jgi:hypothetical protein
MNGHYVSIGNACSKDYPFNATGVFVAHCACGWEDRGDGTKASALRAARDHERGIADTR